MRRNVWPPVAILLSSTLAWPTIQLAVFLLRFKKLPPGGWRDALVFAPMGFAAGLVAAVLYALADSRDGRRAVIVGYVVAAPFAFVGSLLGGLFLPGIWGPLLLGAVPLIAGSLIGFVVRGRRIRPPSHASN